MPRSLEYPFRYVLRLKAGGSSQDDIVSDIVDTRATWRIDHIACVDKTNSLTSISLLIGGNGEEYFVAEQQDPDVDTLYWWRWAVYLEEGDWLIARFKGATLNDVLELYFMGVELRPRRR